MTDLAVELGRQRIAQLRELAMTTQPGSTRTATLLIWNVKGDNEAYVTVPTRELIAMLDRLEALNDRDS